MLQPREITEAYFRKMEMLLMKFNRNLPAQTVHEFRVMVKKLRAFLSLFDRPRNQLKLPDDFLMMYHALGHLRDFQQAGQHILHAEKKKCLHHARRSLITLERLREIERDIGQRLPLTLSAPLVVRRITSLRNRIRNIVYENHLRAEQLHEIRKLVKNILYLQALLPSNTMRANERIPVSPSSLDTIAHQLGIFNDITKRVELLKNYDDNVDLDELKKASRQKQRHLRTMLKMEFT